MKQHQVIAVQKQAHSDGEGALTKAYQLLDKPVLLSGILKTYEPLDEAGTKLPSESTKLQTRVPVVLRGVVPFLSRQLDLQVTLDAGNQIATANVVVDDKVLLPNVPVETLLFLEKRLNTWVEFIGKLPVLDESEDWTDAGDGLSFKSATTSKVRTDKVPTRFVKAEATDKHPAQVDVLYLDQVVGNWNTTKFSGAITAARKADLLGRLKKVLAAVQVARAEANSIDVPDRQIAKDLFGYLGWAE